MRKQTRAALRRSDEAFEKLLREIEFAARETDLTPELRAGRLTRCTQNTPESERQFCKEYFPTIFTEPWNGFHLHISGLEEGSHTISGFRRGGKTAYAVVGKIIRHICLGRGGLVGMNLRTLEKAKARTALVVRIITANKKLMYDFEVEVEQDAKEYYILGPKGQKATHLIAGSYQTGLRSYVDESFDRFQLALNDDLYDRQSVDSERDNEKVTNFVAAEVRGQMEGGGLDLTLGNSISAGCPIQQLKKMQPENHFSLPALDANGRSGWPEAYTAEDWAEKREAMPYDTWMGEYMDDPAVKGDIFKPEWLRSVNLTLVQVVASISAIDPSHGQSPSACFKGIATLGMTSSKEAVMLDLYIRREGYIHVFDYLLALRARLGADGCAHKVVLFENDFSQWNFAKPYYQMWMDERRATLPILTYSSKETATEFRGADKDSRILNLVHPHQTGSFAYAEQCTGSADFDTYKRQYLAFGKRKEKLDGLDAAATAYIMIRRYLDEGSFKSLHRRTFARPTWTGGFFG